MIKLYPEGKSEGRFKIRGVKRIIYYCNHDGLFYVDVVRGIDDKEKEIESYMEDCFSVQLTNR